MAAYSTIDALNTLCTSIPEWNTRLDELNGQIALRQIELARLEEDRPPPVRSLKYKGSTESLRPKKEEDNLPSSHDADNTQSTPVESPKTLQNGFSTQRPGSSAAARAPAAVTPPSPNNNSNPRPYPGAALTRQSSQPTPPSQSRIAPGVLRKRKTESLASGETVAPKYRTRSMIIVYYDSAVQSAFEELVKFVSGSRNAMRKGKMAAKMADMRRAAELEVEAEDDDEDEQSYDLVTGSRTLLTAQKNVTAGMAGESLVPGSIPAADSDSGNGGEWSMPQLRFVSTRQMGQGPGPKRDYTANDPLGSTLSVGLLRGYRRSGRDGQPDIFDELDKGLEWCQSQCEHAAHQFLRDGECTTEIENIKRKLGEVRETAEKEEEKLRKEEAESPTPKPTKQVISEQGKSRGMKSVYMRKDLGTLRDLEVDDMEVDDSDGFDALNPPELIFKRSRDVGR